MEQPQRNFVAIDLEWADSAQHICQFGLAVVREGRVVEQRTWAIQPPDNHYEQKQMGVHRMSPEATADSPTFAQAWPEIAPYLRGQQLWAHNSTSAEQPVLEKNLMWNGIDEHFTVNESIFLFSRPNQKTWNDGLGLRPCLYAVGLPCEHHHDAGADAAMCAELIIAWQNGALPDWELSDKKMAEYEAAKQAEKEQERRRYQAQQLDLFADTVCSTCNDDNTGRTPTFFSGAFDSKQDGTDTIDYARLNTSDTNPVYGASVALTGFFHVKRSHLREALKKMGAQLKQTITKSVQVVLLGERNVGPAKIEELQNLIHNGYNIARVSGDADLDRLLYDATLTPADFNVPAAARKELNFTISHFRKHHFAIEGSVNPLCRKEFYLPRTGFMGRTDMLSQMFGNLGAFANYDYYPEINIVVLPNSTIDRLQNHEKDDVIREFEAYYNSQRTVHFDAEFITERDFLKFVRQWIVRFDDDVTGELYRLYLQSAGIDPERDFKYGLAEERKTQASTE